MKQAPSASAASREPELTERHGYRIEGDLVTLNAELSVAAGARLDGYSLELFARELPLKEASTRDQLMAQAHRIAQLTLTIPTPIRPQSHHIEATTHAHLPIADRTYLVFLALIDAKGRVQHISDYPRTERFMAPRLLGNVGYEIVDDDVILSVECIENPRAPDNQSGTLCLELGAVEHPLARAGGNVLASCELPALSGQFQFVGVTRRVPCTPPPNGRWTMVLRLREWTEAHGYVTRDQRVFDVPFIREEPTTDSVTDRANDTTQEPAPGPVPVFVHEASIEQLTRVPGVTRKLAQEIIKARPFSSYDDLLRVKGIGKRTLQKLRVWLKV